MIEKKKQRSGEDETGNWEGVMDRRRREGGRRDLNSEERERRTSCNEVQGLTVGIERKMDGRIRGIRRIKPSFFPFLLIVTFVSKSRSGFFFFFFFIFFLC